VSTVTPNGWGLRPPTLGDAAAMAEVANAASQALYGQDQVAEERVRNWLSASDRDLEFGIRLLVDRESRVIGWAEADDPGEPHVLIEARLAVHPAVADQPEAWDALLRWLESRARSFIPNAPEGTRIALTVDAATVDTPRITALERFGASRVRVMNRMRIDLGEALLQSPAWPNGVVLRTLDPEVDLRVLGEASQEVFRDHWGMVEQSVDEEMRSWREWIDSQGEGFDRTLSFLAVAPHSERSGCDVVAGFSLCRPNMPGSVDLGILGSLGVRPAWRGQGLGLALITHSFGEFHRRGYQAVELVVDTGSLTGALRLYERAGMRPIRQQFVYEKELRPGQDLVKREL